MSDTKAKVLFSLYGALNLILMQLDFGGPAGKDRQRAIAGPDVWTLVCLRVCVYVCTVGPTISEWYKFCSSRTSGMFWNCF